MSCRELMVVAQCCRNDVPLEYSGEEQAICAVGFVKPRPGVFVEAIQYVLILCTTVEVGHPLGTWHPLSHVLMHQTRNCISAMSWTSSSADNQVLTSVKIHCLSRASFQVQQQNLLPQKWSR